MNMLWYFFLFNNLNDITETLLKVALSTIKRNQTVLGYIKKKEILCQHSLINTNFGGNI
jgi:hypothetical protein